MAIGSTLFKVGGALLGGLFGKKEKKAPSAYEQTMQGIQGQAEGARKYGEEFGFNPLTLLGVSQPMGQGAAPENYMGNAIADAALLAADDIAQNAAAQKLERAERLNSKLQQQVTDLTIRPKVGGIYDQRVATPTVRQALGVSNAWPNTAANISGYSGEVFGYSRDGELVTPKERHTSETIHNDGQATDVPVGPDFDEIVSGWIIQQRNKKKAKDAAFAATLGRSDMTYGTPLGPKRVVLAGSPLSGPIVYDDYSVNHPPPYSASKKYREHKTVLRNGKRVRVSKHSWEY